MVIFPDKNLGLRPQAGLDGGTSDDFVTSRMGESGASIKYVRTEGGREFGPKADDSTDRLRECYSDKGEGVLSPKIFADVINGSP